MIEVNVSGEKQVVFTAEDMMMFCRIYSGNHPTMYTEFKGLKMKEKLDLYIKLFKNDKPQFDAGYRYGIEDSIKMIKEVFITSIKELEQRIHS